MTGSRVAARGSQRVSLRRALLIVMPTLAAFGGLLNVIGPIYAFRLAVVCFFFISISPWPVRSTTRYRNLLSVVALAWLGIGALLIPSSLEPSVGVRELANIAYGMMFVAAVVRWWKPGETLADLRLGWMIAFVITGAIGTWESITGNHLSNYYRAGNVPTYGGNLIASTFSNPNSYAVFLSAGVVVLLTLINEKRPRRVRVALVLATMWWVYLLISTGGRLCLAAALVAALVWLILTHGRGGKSFLVIGAGTIVAVLFAGSTGLLDLPTKVAHLSLTSLAQSALQAGSSGNVRVNLAVDGLSMLVRTVGIGVGPGNYNAQALKYPVANTGGLGNPHNGIMELAAQYGLLVFILFLIAMIKPLRWALRLRTTPTDASSPESVIANRVVVLCLAAQFIPLSLADSTMWIDPKIWIFVALYVTAALRLEPTLPLGKAPPDEARPTRRALHG